VATAFFAIWGVWVLAAQASGQYLTQPGLSVTQFLERNAWPIFTGLVGGLAAYLKMSFRADVQERDIAELKRTKADAQLMAEQVGSLKAGMEDLKTEVRGLRGDFPKLVHSIAEAIKHGRDI
jgi:hypothetical protein